MPMSFYYANSGTLEKIVRSIFSISEEGYYTYKSTGKNIGAPVFLERRSKK